MGNLKFSKAPMTDFVRAENETIRVEINPRTNEVFIKNKRNDRSELRINASHPDITISCSQGTLTPTAFNGISGIKALPGKVYGPNPNGTPQSIQEALNEVQS